ncbi:MAG: CDP-diacylglycerol--glycerol-3-phosphate 3-phosphatidyltransferase [Firmicutes bacterium]|nr:CDP-diacylglycerol--glycerol-3-phosphate 3-phosphatidyltransferase [Bacillota bacterium]
MNLATKITLARIVLIPVFVFFCLATFIPYAQWVAFGIFALAVFTDILDGFIARRFNQVTDLGKFLDPIADKIIVAAALVIVVQFDLLPFPYASLALIIILTREFIIATFRQFAASKNLVLQADFWGKLKTNFQNLAILLLVLLIPNDYFEFSGTLLDIITYSAYVVTALAVLLTVVSGFNYIFKNLSVFKEKEIGE